MRPWFIGMGCGMVLLGCLGSAPGWAFPRAGWNHPRGNYPVSFNLNQQEVLDRSFRLSVRDGRFADAKEAFKKGARVNSRSDQGATALIYAAGRCRQKLARWLIENGAEVDVRDHLGRTALIHAARATCVPVVRILTHHPDVEIGVRDQNGKRAIDYAHGAGALAVGGPESEVIRLLEKE